MRCFGRVAGGRPGRSADQAAVRYTDGMAVRVRVLGGLAVEGVDLARLSSRKARRLLSRLAIARGSSVGVDTLAQVVWGAELPSHPADQLSVLVSRLRSALGADRLTRTQAGYTLTADWLDVVALAELAVEARRRLDAGAVAPATAAARAALDLLRGPVLPEEPDDTEWLEAERADAGRYAAAARLVAAEAVLASGDPWTASALAERALDAEPYDEAALRAVMSAHQAAGRPAVALRAYAAAADRLRHELGVDPAAETQALHLRLLRAEPVQRRAAGHAGTAPKGTRATASGSAAMTALAGREAELTELTRSFDRAASGQPQLVVVEGEAGIGKTRLLAEFTGQLETERPGAALVLRCRGDELSGGLPLQPLLDALAGLLRTPPHHGDDAFGPHLLDSEALLAGEAEPVLRLLGEVPTGALWVGGLTAGSGAALGAPALGVAAAGPATAGLAADVDTGLSLAFAAYDTVISRLADQWPVVLVVDDAQWADPATRAWLHHAVRRHSAVRLLILAARRTGEGTALRGDTLVRLGPLDQAAAATALGLPAGSLRALQLHERSGGHPMFLWELSRAGDGDLPASIRESVIDRCERAGPGVAATLRAAAVLGSDVDLEMLAAVLDERVTSLLDHLEVGVRRHLLVESGAGFQFAHELMRDSLRTGTSMPRATLLHRQAARSLAARTNAEPLTVAYHARLGGDLAAAATALAKAGEIAAARFDLAEAGRLFDEALSLDDRPDLLVRRARIRLRVSDTAGAAADTRAVRERVAPDDPNYAAALEVAALVSYVERDFDRCARLAEEGAAVATDPEVRASCLALAGRVRHAIGDLPGARELLDRVGSEAPASVAPLVETWRAFLLVHGDDPAAALRLVQADEPIQPRVGYPFAAITRHMVAGYAQALRGEPAAALREFDLMSDAAARERTERFSARDDNFRGWILRSVGALGEADEANTRAYELAATHGLAEPLAHALLDLADGRLRAGDPAMAETYLARLGPEVDDGYLFQWRTELRTGLVSGRWLLATGDVAVAASAFETVRETAARLSLRRYLVLSRLWLAMSRRRLGERIAADELASDVDALVEVAPMEAWWLTAEAGRVFDVDRWRTLALDRARTLASRAGPYGDTLRRVAGRRIAGTGE